MREFAVAIGKAGVKEPHDITFKLGEDELTAKAPTVGQLALFLQGGMEGGFKSVASLFEFVSDVLNDRDWRIVQNHLRDGLDVAVVNEIAGHLIGEWAGRPTGAFSASSVSPNGTGEQSTEKLPFTAETSSTSTSTDSATPSSGGPSSE